MYEKPNRKTPLDANGHSLRRVSHTDDNETDFACGDPADPTNNAGESALLAATIRTDDRLFRYGSKQMVLILQHQRLAGLATAAERLRRRVVGEGMEHRGNNPPCVTVSVGGGVFDPDDPRAEELTELGQAHSAALATLDQRDLDVNNLSALHTEALATIDERDAQIVEFDRRLAQTGEELSQALSKLREIQRILSLPVLGHLLRLVKWLYEKR